LSDSPDQGTAHSIQDIPSSLDCAVVGLQKGKTENAIIELKKKGILRCWIHWRTETDQAKARCEQLQMQYIAGKCPMMYLSQGLNIHTIHAWIAGVRDKH
ncbi:MAG: CoA-binding protein, partial [Methanothrix sp.]|nr:CoA-binding protein [Methanothrix sp.]